MPSLVDTGAYLDQLYQEKFGRVPDAEGKAYWKAELESGKTSPEKIAQIFDNTDEAKQVKESRDQEARDFLEKTYAEELGREPDAEGAEYWANEISSGRQTQDDVVNNIRRSDEYQEQREPESESRPSQSLPNRPDSDNPEEWGRPVSEEQWQQQYDNQFNAAVGDTATQETDDSTLEAQAEVGNPEVGLPYIDPDSEQGKRQAINDIYRDVLERNTDQGGEDYWYEELESGRQTLDDIRSNVERSDEAANLESNKAFIEEQYQSGLDRGTQDNVNDAADPYGGGMGYWLKDLATGQSREDVAANIRRSDEFSTQAEDYLDGLYENILERDPDDEGLAYWKEQLVSGNQTREDVAANINMSDEKWLGDTYKTELGRPLGDEGREYWLDDMWERGQTREQVLANIRRSEEYLNRGEQECPTGQHLENGVCVNDAVTECPEGQRIENGQCVPDVKVCTMVACPEGQMKNEDCECVDVEEPDPEGECPEGLSKNQWGECVDFNAECPDGYTQGVDGGCVPGVQVMKQCPDGSMIPESETCPTEEDTTCPTGQTRNAAGNCETDPNTLPDTECPDGYTRNESGACVEDPGTWTGEDPTEDDDIGNWMGDDPSEKIKAEEDETKDPLTTTDPLNKTEALPGGMPRQGANPGDGDFGYRRTNEGYRDLFNGIKRRRGEEDDVGYSELRSRYGRLKADYDSARREADSYRDAQRADETSRLRSGITVGGAPGSRRTDLRSGNTATSDRSRRRGISARSNRERDRSPSMQGIRSGF